MHDLPCCAFASVTPAAAAGVLVSEKTHCAFPLEMSLTHSQLTNMIRFRPSQFGSQRLGARVGCTGLTLAALLISPIVMAQNCPLTTPLILKDTQDGFAGQTGTVWAITPGCNFTVAQQIGTKITDPIREGRLTPQQEMLLKEQLNRTAGMPAQLGDGPQVNARRIMLSYEGRVSVLILPPGGGDLSALRAAVGEGPTGRLLELAETVKRMTGT
jgi:hypothetical protein